MEAEIRNKVAESGIITLNPEDYFPVEDIAVFDIKDFLFREMILKEKDFREKLKETDWEAYRGKIVAVTCSAEAIIPMWGFMLVVTYLQPLVEFVAVGTKEEIQQQLLLQNITQMSVEEYRDKRVVLKGCGDLPVGEKAYATLTRVLLPVVKSLMYGEPCSTVPVYKKR